MKVSLAVIIAVFLMAGIVNAVGCGDTLSSPGTYTLTSDLTGCAGNGIIIGASNIILDCNGYKLTGSNVSNSYGIFSTGTGNVIKTV